jgi:hypothetical protein
LPVLALKSGTLWGTSDIEQNGSETGTEILNKFSKDDVKNPFYPRRKLSEVADNNEAFSPSWLNDRIP